MRKLGLFLALLPSFAFAQADSAATPVSAMGSSQFASMLPLLAIFGVFYFLLIRPQQKRMKEHQAMLGQLKKNDEVVTAGGIVGKVTKVTSDSDTATVEIAKGVEVSIIKSTITQVRGKDLAKPANSNPKKNGSVKNDNVVLGKDQVANDN